jgi:hypothetical protein
MSGSLSTTSDLPPSDSQTIARSQTDGSIFTAEPPESLQTRATDPSGFSTDPHGNQVTRSGRPRPRRPPREKEVAEDDQYLITWQRALKEGATITPDTEPARKNSIPFADKIRKKFGKLKKKARGGSSSPEDSRDRTLDVSEPSTQSPINLSVQTADQDLSGASESVQQRESTVLGNFPNYAGSESDPSSTPEASNTPVRTLNQSQEQSGATESEEPGEKAAMQAAEPKRLSFYAQRDDSDGGSAVLGEHYKYAGDTSESDSDDDGRRLLDRSRRRRRRDSSPSVGTINVEFPLPGGTMRNVSLRSPEESSPPALTAASSSSRQPTVQQNPAAEGSATKSSSRPQKQGEFRKAYSDGIPLYGPRR